MRRIVHGFALLLVLTLAREAEAGKEKFDRSKPHVNVGTIGHVDHGKNTLTAAIINILRADGAPTFPPLPQNVRGSDNGAHGIVMHSCDVEYETPERIYRHIDCGGDENFVRNWIMGDPVIIEAAVLVVNATDGPTPQTREHILLARQTGVPIPVVFMNKADLVDPIALDVVEEEVRQLLAEFMYPRDPPFVRGNIEGALLGEPPHVEATGHLVDNLDIFIVPTSNPADKPFLMPVEDVFSIKGRGTVAEGRVERGTVKEGDLIEIVGLGPTRTVEVAGLEMVRQAFDAAAPGDKVGVLLRGVGKDEVERGQVLAAPGSIMPHKTFAAEIYVLDRDDGGGNRTPFFSGYRPQFYFRATDVTGAIDLLPPLTMIAPGEHDTVMVELDEEIALEAGQRFEVRDGRRRVGAGVVAADGVH
jgi:elongation factor Tu